MKIAVTGAGGFVGINLVQHLCARGHSVTALDRRFSDRVAMTLRGFGDAVCETVDVLEEAALKTALARHRPDVMFHGAAVTADLGRERAAFGDILAVNITGTARALEASRAAGVRRVIVASSSAVYGDAVFGRSPKETDVPDPVSLYGISKLAAERAALRFGVIHDMDVRAVRIAAVFGPWEHRSGARDVMSPLFQIAEKAVAGAPAVLPEGGARDWIAAGRVATVLGAMLERPRLEHHVYNLSAAAPWPPKLFRDALAKLLPEGRGDDATPNIDYRDDLSRQRFPLDTGRLRAEFGADCLGVAEAEVAAFANWVFTHQDWFQSDARRTSS